MPGRIIRLFMRAATGEIMTQQQVNGAFPGTWQAVGAFTAAGSPAALLDPALGRLAVVARGLDNEVYRVFETAAGSGQWGGWARILADGASDPASSDPTVAPISDSSGQTWVIAFRNINDAVRVYERRLITQAGAAARSASPAVAFTGHPAPSPGCEEAGHHRRAVAPATDNTSPARPATIVAGRAAARSADIATGIKRPRFARRGAGYASIRKGTDGRRAER